MARTYDNQLNGGEWVRVHSRLEHTAQAVFAEWVDFRRNFDVFEPEVGIIFFVVYAAVAVDHQNLWLLLKRALQGLVIKVTFEDFILFFLLF